MSFKEQHSSSPLYGKSLVYLEEIEEEINEHDYNGRES